MTLTEFVYAARYEVGTTENPPRSNCQPYSHELGRPCHYWCADFTAAMMRRAGADYPQGADTASTRVNLAAWRKAGRFVPRGQLRPGDIAFFHISGRNGNDPNVPDHTGIVIEAPAAGRVVTIEGNTSPSDHGSQDNGGGVYQRTRPLGVVIGGGRPIFHDAPTTPAHRGDEDNMKFLLTPDGGGIVTFIYDDDKRTLKELSGKVLASPDEFKNLVARGWLKPYNPANDQERIDPPTFEFLTRKQG